MAASIKRKTTSITLSSEEVMKSVFDTHVADPAKAAINFKPMLDIIENILFRATPCIDSVLTGTTNSNQESRPPSYPLPFEGLAPIIHEVFCEISCMCASERDAHATTMALLKLDTLKKYAWDAKVVITLAAFALSYGDFGLSAQLYTTNGLVHDIALLMQLPNVIVQGKTLKPQFDEITALIKIVVELTKCMLQFRNLDTNYASHDKPPMSVAMAEIHVHSYWAIHSVAACASQIAGILRFTEEPSLVYSISKLNGRVTSGLAFLQQQLENCREYIEEKRSEDAYKAIVTLFKTPQDITKILTTLLDLRSLVDRSGNKLVEINIFSKKPLLFLISGIDISIEEIEELRDLYNKQKQEVYQYELIWLPIVYESTWDKKKFDDLRALMPWYIVNDPSSIKFEVQRYIEKEWNYTKKVKVVALDSQGKLLSMNCLELLRIWRNSAFPFNIEHERSLWQAASSTLKILFDGIDDEALKWIKAEKRVCFYGGKDIKWIEQFTKAAKDADKSLGLVYVGKRSAMKAVKENIGIITGKNYSHSLSASAIWSFWTRLESILFTKSRMDVDNGMMKAVITLLNLDGRDEGWAFLCQGSSIIDKAEGTVDNIVGKLLGSNEVTVDPSYAIGFEGPTPGKHLVTKHCIHFVLPENSLEIKQGMHCIECGKIMQKYIMYKCCVDVE